MKNHSGMLLLVYICVCSDDLQSNVAAVQGIAVLKQRQETSLSIQHEFRVCASWLTSTEDVKYPFLVLSH